jgi:molecular chaperone GrpE
MSEAPTGGAVGPDGEEHERPVVRDKRRFDPETGERRPDVPDASVTPDPMDQAEAAVEGASADVVAELTEDLQRQQAEFDNYRRRVERDRKAVG